MEALARRQFLKFLATSPLLGCTMAGRLLKDTGSFGDGPHAVTPLPISSAGNCLFSYDEPVRRDDYRVTVIASLVAIRV